MFSSLYFKNCILFLNFDVSFQRAGNRIFLVFLGGKKIPVKNNWEWQPKNIKMITDLLLQLKALEWFEGEKKMRNICSWFKQIKQQTKK